MKSTTKQQRKRNQNRPQGRRSKKNLTSRFRSRTVQLPAAKTKQVRTNSRLRTLTLSHKEFVRDIYAPQDATNQIFSINPGIKTSFPWLANIANNFETYRFTKLWFEYIPNVGTSTDGAITIAPDYDAADNNSDASKSTLFSFEDTLRSPLWATARMVCSPKNLQKQKNYFIRNSSLRTNLDIKMYDPLSLIVLVTGAKDVTVGELWVHYTIVLETPQIETVDPDEFNIVDNLMTHTTVNTPFSNVNKSSILGSLADQLKATLEDGDTIGIRSAGSYLIDLLGHAILPDTQNAPSQKSMSMGQKFTDRHKLAEWNTFDTISHLLKYGAQWIVKADEASEDTPYPNGTNVTWEGLNTEGATFTSGAYNFLARKITDELYGKLAAAAIAREKSILEAKKKQSERKKEMVKMSDEQVKRLLKKHNMELL